MKGDSCDPVDVPTFLSICQMLQGCEDAPAVPPNIARNFQGVCDMADVECPVEPSEVLATTDDAVIVINGFPVQLYGLDDEIIPDSSGDWGGSSALFGPFEEEIVVKGFEVTYFIEDTVYTKVVRFDFTSPTTVPAGDYLNGGTTNPIFDNAPPTWLDIVGTAFDAEVGVPREITLDDLGALLTIDEPDDDDVIIHIGGLFVENGALTLNGTPVVDTQQVMQAGDILAFTPSVQGENNFVSLWLYDEWGHGPATPSITLSLNVLPSLRVADLQTNYTMIEGADPAILYDQPAPGYAGLTNNGDVGLVGFPQYTPTYLGAPTYGYEFNDDIRVLTQPPGVSTPTKTEMWAVRNKERRMSPLEGFYGAFDPQFFQHVDGRPFIGSIGSEQFSPAEPFLGDQIVTIRWGDDPTIFYGDREVTGYMQRPASRDHAAIGSQNFIGYAAGLQRAGQGTRWYMKRSWTEYLTNEEIVEQVGVMTRELEARGITLGDSKSRSLPVVGFYGDSVTGGVGPTEHYVKRLQAHIGGGDMRTQVIGYGGMTSATMVTRMDEVAASGRAYGDGDFIGVLFFGINDLLQNYTAAQIIANFTTLVTKLRDAGATRVIIMTPMRSNWAALGGDFPTIDAVYEDLCGMILNGDPGQDDVCDLTGTALGFGSDLDENRTDQIHPDDDGSEIIAANLGPVLVTAGV